MVTRRLYAKIDVELPQEEHPALARREQLIFRPHVVRALREFSVRNGHMMVKISANNRSGTSEGDMVDGFVRQVIDNVPQDQLIAFR